MSRFEPVRLPEPLGSRASQTMLRHFSACPRSAYLYALHKGEARTREMERGKALHELAARSIQACIENGEVTIPAEVVKAIADEVLADPSMAVPFEEHDHIREMSYRWAEEMAVDPEAVVACETLFVLDVAGWEVRCRIDFAEVLNAGAVCAVRDWKSSMAAPPYDEVARKRKDGSLAAKHFQLVLYALVLAYGVPVREEECPICMGLGDVADIPETEMTFVDTPRRPCMRCNGKGYEEVCEPFPVASRAQRFDLEFVYPAIENSEGRMVRRPLTLTRLELEAYRMSLEGLVTRLAASEASGDWPAVVSDAACSECPASWQCPIPREVRDHRGEINSPEQCADALEVRYRLAADLRAVGREIRNFVKSRGPVRYGNGMVAEIGHTESTRIVDKEGLFEAVDRAVRFGEPYERAKFVKAVESFPLVERALAADEIEEEGSG